MLAMPANFGALFKWVFSRKPTSQLATASAAVPVDVPADTLETVPEPDGASVVELPKKQVKSAAKPKKKTPKRKPKTPVPDNNQEDLPDAAE